MRLTEVERLAVTAVLPADPDAPFLLLDEIERILAAHSADAWDEGEAAGLNNASVAEDGEFAHNPYRALLDAAPAGGAEDTVEVSPGAFMEFEAPGNGAPISEPLDARKRGPS